MHGTFLNEEKVEEAAEIHAGDEVILGGPVYRHQAEYQPALVRVDDLEFTKAVVPASIVSAQPTFYVTSTNRFAVPEDCEDCDDYSSDENEAAGLNEARIVHQRLFQRDGPTDITTEPRLEAPPMERSSFSNGGLRAGPLVASLSDDESEGVDRGNDGDSDLGDDPETEVDFDALSSINGDEQHMDHESVADEGETPLVGDYDSDSVFDSNADADSNADLDSNASNASERSHFDDAENAEIAQWEEQPQLGPFARTLHRESTPFAAPSEGSVLLPFPPLADFTDFYARPDWIPRSSSPSDFVFSHRRSNAPLAPNGDAGRFQGAVASEEGPQRTEKGIPTGNSIGNTGIVAESSDQLEAEATEIGDKSFAGASVTVADLARKSGKPEFFEARAVNKEAVAQNAFLSSPCQFWAPKHVGSNSISESAFRFVSLRGDDYVDQHHTERSTDKDSMDDQHHEEHSTDKDSTDEHHAGQSTDKDSMNEAPIDPVTKHHDASNKRKFADISDEAQRFSNLMDCLNAPSPRPEVVEAPLPSPPESPELEAKLGEADPINRPSKKMKKIAEAVGFAALGGISVGAAVLGSLIYTAPNFV